MLEPYPLRFEPRYEYRPWGGRRLAGLAGAVLPGSGPIGEAWLISDLEQDSSVVANGALRGVTLRQLMQSSTEYLLGRRDSQDERFPLLLKFLDVSGSLSVQVHPTDEQAALMQPGSAGKTEGWVVLAVGREALIYAGLKSATTAPALRQVIAEHSVVAHLASFRPQAGDAVLIPAGIIHALQDLVVFEVQETSDLTYRLYDWDRVDAKTGARRPLQIDAALACIDYRRTDIGPATPLPDAGTHPVRERLLGCDHFVVSRINTHAEFRLGMAGELSILVCINGKGELVHGGARQAIATGDAVLLPAALGTCACVPDGAIVLLEVSLPSPA